MQDARSLEPAARLREAVLGAGSAPATLRAAALAGDVDDPQHGALIARIRAEAHRVTDGEIASLREHVGSDRAAFEVVLAASIGAGLDRRDVALTALEGAADAPA